MKFFSAICATALTLSGTAPVSAQTYSPSVGTVVFKGVVTVKKGLNLRCTLKVTVNLTSHTAAVSPSLSAPDDILCPNVTFSGQPYTVYFDGTTLFVSGIVVNTLTPGGCSGTIGGIWGGNSVSPRFITLHSSLLGGGTSCTIDGSILQVSGSPLSITWP